MEFLEEPLEEIFRHILGEIPKQNSGRFSEEILVGISEETHEQHIS